MEEVSVDAVVAGKVGADDIRISREGLEHQAEAARAHGDVQLAENLLRAAELTALSDDELLEYYELLRPGRAEPTQLRVIGDKLASRGATRVAALFAEAAVAYARRQHV